MLAAASPRHLHGIRIVSSLPIAAEGVRKPIRGSLLNNEAYWGRLRDPGMLMLAVFLCATAALEKAHYAAK